ncbi:hypothetical protein C5167_029965 [Papaver somniferum]|uniref:probable pterin-4-alpha-carbinolamine dehydratase, chloroplastic n=1 Tax=Papaver somniferum TaxID=3469 RepID=UPI000E6FD43A|nr:probable pterin-4-alpha-carbinolamine dehydratase, chloroplastic [Papaver somniferum]RZC86616.1 hypothetical protein C5167_029965 [Papaver somniferum]
MALNLSSSLCFQFRTPISAPKHQEFSFNFNSTPLIHRNDRKVVTCGLGGDDMLGDFGARDPFPAEIESQFGDKVLGSGNTEHKILIPNISALSLSSQESTPLDPSQPPLTKQVAQQLLRKVIGWRLAEDDGTGILRLQCLWKLKDYKSGIELINRIYNVAAATGYYPDLHLEQPNQVRAQIYTPSIGGLSMNDFILAAKIDDIKTSDLVPKKRVWA